MAIKVKVGGSKSIRAVPKQDTNRSLVAQGQSKAVITPDSVTLGPDTVGNYVKGVTAGDGIVVTPNTHIESANVFIRHANTSTAVSTVNDPLDFVRNVNIDSFGHVTGFENMTFSFLAFNANNGIIYPKDFTIGDQNLTFGDTTNVLTGLSTLEVGELTFTQGRITGTDDIVISPTFGGVVDVNLHRIVNLDTPVDEGDAVSRAYLDDQLDNLTISLQIFNDPVLPTDAANKRYVDNITEAQNEMRKAYAATTADLGGTFATGNSTYRDTIDLGTGATLTIDGVSDWSLGDGVLVKNQTDGSQNGRYQFIRIGDNINNWILQRSLYADDADEIPGVPIFVTDGTVNGQTGWVGYVDDPANFDPSTDDVYFRQFQGPGIDGRGITLNVDELQLDLSQTFDSITPNTGVLEIGGTGGLRIPQGTTAQRPTPTQGQIRYNTTDSQFEGYDGSVWSGLGGTIDVDQDTKIIAESSPGADNDQLQFFTAGNLRLTVDSDGTVDVEKRLVIPVGGTADRLSPAIQGSIRFNSDDSAFEGYDGSNWGTLGGVKDADQDTYVTAETTSGLDNDQLDFYTGGVHRLRIDSDGDFKYGAGLNQFTIDYDTGQTYINGLVTIAGNITLGDANTDSITVISDFDSHLIPDAHNTYDLGSTTKDWRTLHVENITSVDGTIDFDTTGAIIVPDGTTAQRPSPVIGMIRFNTEDGRFEAYDGNVWGGLAGSVIDVDRDTYIVAEETSGADDDKLQFYTGGTEAFIVTNNQVITTSTNNLQLGSATGIIDSGNTIITNVRSPVNPKDVVTKQYLENEFDSTLDLRTGGSFEFSSPLNLLASPTIKLERGLSLQNYSAANNEVELGLDTPGSVTPGIYGNDGFTPRIRIDSTGRIDFATEIAVELQANAIPDFTETSRDIIGLMFTDGVQNEGVRISNDDANDVFVVTVDDFNLELAGDVTGTVSITALANTTINTTISTNYLSDIEAGNGVSILGSPSANAVLTVVHADTSSAPSVTQGSGNVIQNIGLDQFGHVTSTGSVNLDNRFVNLSGSSIITGDLTFNRFIDINDTQFIVDPHQNTKLSTLTLGTTSGYSQVEMIDSTSTSTYMYAVNRQIGFLKTNFNFAAYANVLTGDWYVDRNVEASKFIDHDDSNYFLNPSGLDSKVKKLTLDDSLVVDDLTLNGTTISATGSDLVLDAVGGSNVDVNNSKIINVSAPTSNLDAANKQYVDAAIQGLRIIPAALVATTADLGGTYDNPSGTISLGTGNSKTIDGVSLGAGDIILVKDQTNPEENGSYTVTTAGDIFNAWIITRGEYFNEASEIPGSFQFVTDGTVNNGTGWVVHVDDAETFALGTDDVDWYQFSGAGTYSAGAGLDLNGTVFSIANTGVTPSTYGSSTQIPVLTVAADGRITLANTASVAGVDNFTYDSANNQLALTTGDGSVFNIYLNEFKDLTVEDLTANSINITNLGFDTLDVEGDISANNAHFAGNINVTGTVDGRDIAADGLILDGLSAATTTVQLNGDVTGQATSANGVISITADIANTGVTTGTYGSASQIPVVTVGLDGRITSIANTAVAGVDDFFFTDANNTLTIETGDGSRFNAKIAKLDRIEEDLTIQLNGDVTGTVTSNTGVMSVTTDIANSGVVADTYGSANTIPVVTVGLDGRVTSATTVSVDIPAGVESLNWNTANNTLGLRTSDDIFYAEISQFDGTVDFNDDVSIENILTLTDTPTGVGYSGDLKLIALSQTSIVPAYGSSTSYITSKTYSTGLADLVITAGDRTVQFNSDILLQQNQDIVFEGSTTDANTTTFTVIDPTAPRTITLPDTSGTVLTTGNGADLLTTILTIDGNGSGIDADSVDGYSAQGLLDASANTAANLIGDGSVTILSNTGITVGGDPTFNLNSANTFTIDISHSDTSSVSDVNLSLPQVITGMTFDTFGHVQSVANTNLDDRYYTETELDAGQLNSLYYTETELDGGQLDSRYYTESELDAGQLDNRYYTETELDAGQLDNRYYTETELDGGQLDSRYYTETEADAKFVDVTGDTMSGDLVVNANIDQSQSRFFSTEVTASSTLPTVIMQFAHATFGSAEIVITAKDGSNRHVTKLLVTHNGSDAIATEFATIYTSSELASYDVGISGANLNILGSSVSGATNYKIVATLSKA